MNTSRSTRIVLYVYGVLVIAFLYLPLISVGFASVSQARYLSFPIKRYSTKWYGEALASSTVSELLTTSLSVAVLVTLISVVVAFFGALAFARYHWRFRTTFQKLILLPIFFPQTVLGLALLMWFNSLGIIPSWKTAVVAHLVWIAPIATLIVAIRAYSFDPALEEAARDMGAGTFTIIRVHVLSNVLGPVFIYATSLISVSIILAAGLSFLGLGTEPPHPEWGLMLNTLRQSIYVSPWVAALPGVMIFFTSLSFNLMSDGLRSAMDVRL